MKQQDKFHHFLVVGQVHFVHNSDPENILITNPLNAMTMSKTQTIPERGINIAQQSLGRALLTNLDRHKEGLAAEHKIVDIVIHNIMYLGHMSFEEFRAPPPGMKKVEVTSPLAQGMIDSLGSSTEH